ncbi:MAG TPA: SH3 domain-containing protein, partial [Saprospiraceae bacterium]|nr:SH3 domain-containing protein [Saprospiraceae bacterium]
MSTRNTYYCFLLLLLVLPACKNENTDKNSLADNEVVETPVNENKAAPMYVAALSGMNMRATPDIKGEILKLVQYNDKVEVLEKTGIGLEVEG